MLSVKSILLKNILIKNNNLYDKIYFLLAYNTNGIRSDYFLFSSGFIKKIIKPVFLKNQNQTGIDSNLPVLVRLF